MNLLDEDLNYIVRNLPRDVRTLMEKQPIFLAGGYIRSMIAGEPVNDIDLWGGSASELLRQAELFAAKRQVRIIGTDNACTILTLGKTPVQFITRWAYDDPTELAKSFDYSIASAVIWYDSMLGVWMSYCDEYFYPDLAAKRLRYRNPIRNEDAGGSMLRMTKFLNRGYKISPESMGKVMARLFAGFKFDNVDPRNEDWNAKIIISLLREVDPLTLIDGVESVEGNDNEVQ